MQITIDIFSLGLGAFIGIVVGVVITSLAILLTLYDERWSNGFGSGWDACRKSIVKERKEEATNDRLSV